MPARTPRTFSRRNGWSWPPHSLQILAWLVVLYFILVTPLHLIASLSDMTTQIVLYVFAAVLFLTTVIVKLVITTIDPADPNIRYKIRGIPRPKSSSTRIIESNLFCNICEERISEHAKHCRQCNKCVSDFDHHCKWLNNCVGERNYSLFLTYVGLTVITALFILALSVADLIFFATMDEDRLLFENNTVVSLIYDYNENNGAWLCLTCLTLLLSCIVVVLNSHLLAFHIKLIMRGMTTYSFIVQNREREKENILNASTNSTVSMLKPMMSADDEKRRCFKLACFKLKLLMWKVRCNQNSKEANANLKDGEVMPANDTSHLSTNWHPSNDRNAMNSTQKSSADTGSIVTSQTHLGNLPPIQMKKPSHEKLLFDPHVESVLLNGSRELFLPKISVNPPSDTEDTVVEIPLSQFNQPTTKHDASSIVNVADSFRSMLPSKPLFSFENARRYSNASSLPGSHLRGALSTPADPGIYIASGTFKLVKIDPKDIEKLRRTNSERTLQLDQAKTFEDTGSGSFELANRNTNTNTTTENQRRVQFL